uniref:Pentatricopeptide repeat-containing protein n=1 Tax=Rhizophora mucronata TaxID=61149 RepID=A0A2P2PUR1_RHIMU
METFEKMKFLNIQPSQATFVSLISACGHMGLVDQGCFLFGSMKLEHRMAPQSDIYGCMVDMFARNGHLEDAKRVIEMMPYPPWPAILRCLLSGCRIYGNREVGEWAAKNLLQLLPEDDAAYTLLFKVYSEGCSWDDAANLKQGMAERDLKKDLGYSWIEA